MSTGILIIYVPCLHRDYLFQVSSIELNHGILNRKMTSFLELLYNWIIGGNRLPLPWPDYRPRKPPHANEVSEVIYFFAQIVKHVVPLFPSTPTDHPLMLG